MRTLQKKLTTGSDDVTAAEEAKREKIMRESTSAAVGAVIQHLQQMPPAHAFFYLNQLANISLQLLRAGGRQDAEVRCFLQAALRSLDGPPLLFMPEARVH
ncbi:hypothetical protein K6X13_14805 [Xanthomonas euvesicatoria pv. allii]|uniref:hypothetical protein n=1 Tax=Xanthomonas euvesicatoria TaxID=456327 RepID=UPI002406C00B|nr:hypothetical protein [Xanthomonas euvesicatoria]MCP3048350.1 hypothetical protein [Xanthomonas euvesicatoria pv. allii]